jgi:hypothetical protein
MASMAAKTWRAGWLWGLLAWSCEVWFFIAAQTHQSLSHSMGFKANGRSPHRDHAARFLVWGHGQQQKQPGIVDWIRRNQAALAVF